MSVNCETIFMDDSGTRSFPGILVFKIANYYKVSSRFLIPDNKVSIGTDTNDSLCPLIVRKGENLSYLMRIGITFNSGKEMGKLVFNNFDNEWTFTAKQFIDKVTFEPYPKGHLYLIVTSKSAPRLYVSPGIKLLDTYDQENMWPCKERYSDYYLLLVEDDRKICITSYSITL